MKALGGARGTMDIWKTIREVNLGEIKERVERPFKLLVLGDPASAELLALTLSARPGQVGIHPWLALAPLPWPPDGPPFRPDLAIVVTTDAEPLSAERDAVGRLSAMGVPVICIVTGLTAPRMVGAETPRLGESARLVVPDVADLTLLRAALLPAIYATTANIDEFPLALARQLPTLRDAVLELLVEGTARANATYAFTTGVGEIIPVLTIPLALGDTIILTKNQMVMAFKISLVAGKEGRPQKLMTEIIGVIGGGLLLRQIAREMVGLIPVIGIVPKVAIAYAGTKAIGLAIQMWAIEGRRPTRDQMKHWYSQAWYKSRDLAAQLSQRARRDQAPPPLLTDQAAALPLDGSL